MALSSCNPLPTPTHPPKKKRIDKFSQHTFIHTSGTCIYCVMIMQSKNLFTFLSRFTWFRFAGWAFSLGPCFVTIALIFPRYFQEFKTIIYNFFSKYNKIPSCLSLQWRRQSHKVFFLIHITSILQQLSQNNYIISNFLSKIGKNSFHNIYHSSWTSKPSLSQ